MLIAAPRLQCRPTACNPLGLTSNQSLSIHQFFQPVSYFSLVFSSVSAQVKMYGAEVNARIGDSPMSFFTFKIQCPHDTVLNRDMPAFRVIGRESSGTAGLVVRS